MDAKELKPCPFCGGDAHFVDAAHSMAGTDLVMCEGCGCRLYTRELDKWNKREALAVKEAEIALLRDALELCLHYVQTDCWRFCEPSATVTISESKMGREWDRVEPIARTKANAALLPPDEEKDKTCATCGLASITIDNAHTCDSIYHCNEYDHWQAMPDAPKEVKP